MTLPKDLRAACCAASAGIPCSISRAISCWRCASISSEKSSCGRRRKNRISPAPARDRARGPSRRPGGASGSTPAPARRAPAWAAGGTLPRRRGAPGLGQRVEPCPPVVARRAPPGQDEPLRLETLQRRVEGAVLDQQLVVGGRLDGARDPLPVLRAEYQRAQDQDVERALHQHQALGILSGRHLTQV